jgi:PAS domain S-box-containing protein
MIEGCQIIGFDWRYLYVNNAAARHGHLAKETLLGHTMMEIYPGIENTELFAALRLCMNESTPHQIENEFAYPDGMKGWFELSIQPVPEGVFILSIDITERKVAEEALLRQAQIMDQVHEGIVATDLKGLVMSWNPGAERLLGYSAEEALGQPISFIYPQDQLSFLTDEIQPQVRKKGWHETEVRFRSKSGKEIPVQLILAALKNTKGEVVGMTESAIDITERKLAEETIHNLARFPSENPNPVLRIARDGSLVYGNQAAFSLLKKWKLRVGKPAPKVLKNLTREILETDTTKTVDIPCGKRTFSIAIASLRGDMYANLYARDVTERVQAEQEIRKLNAELEQRVEERTLELRQAQDKIVRQEKLAMLGLLAGGVGHELRNPLGIISNAIYYLKLIQPEAEEKVREYHSLIAREVRTSEKIITDLMDYSRLESMDRSQVSVSELVQWTLMRFAVPESIKTTLKLPEDLPEVFVDMGQMQQVLGNLIVNAYQAIAPQGLPSGKPKDGRINISARRLKGRVEISVKDSGVGISPENIGKIFEPLFTTKSKGIGLGLAVSRKLAEANGGRIEVKSEPGKGSTFTLFLPVKGE